ncbi:competence type IV pilus minor pilin ComGD [Virgibacillus oceani]
MVQYLILNLKTTKNKNGFTLIEMLIALSIVMIMLLLVVPISLSTLDAAEEEQFLQTLEFDVLYIQSMAGENLLTSIRFADDHYRIIRGNQEGFIKRDYPKDVTINSRISNEITFDHRGSIRNPRTIEIHTKNASYRMIFPFGKGRYYIEKE